MANKTTDYILKTVFKIHKGEFTKTAIMFMFALNSVSFFIGGRIIRDALFLKRFGRTFLPYMYIATAILVSLCGYIYSRYAGKVKREKLITVTFSFFAISMIVSRFLIDIIGFWFYPVLYILVEILGALVMIQFWTYANEVFHAREARRLFPIIGAGGVLANPIAGFMIKYLVHETGPENILYVCAFFLFACIICTRMMAANYQTSPFEVSTVPKSKTRGIRIANDTSRVFQSTHLKIIAGIVTLTFIVCTFIDYQFKTITASAFDEVKLVSFYGDFYAYTGIFACILQFFVTNRIIERYGIFISLLLLPIGLFGGSLGIFLSPILMMAVAAKGSENIFRYTVNDSSVQLLYLPVPQQIRARAKAFIDAILKPLSQGIAGGILLLLPFIYPDFSVKYISLFNFVIIVVWLVLAFIVKEHYVHCLLETIKKRKLDLSSYRLNINNESSAKVVYQALKTGNDDEILHAIELIPEITYKGYEWNEELKTLLAHKNAKIRSKSVSMLEKNRVFSSADMIFDLFNDDDDGVKASSIRAYCSLRRDKAINHVLPFLKNENPRIKSAAVVGLIKYSGLDGILHAAEVLKNLLYNESPQLRNYGAKVLEAIGVRNFYHPLLKLLEDESIEVQLSSIHAAGQMKSPELIPLLINKLGNKKTAQTAVNTIARFRDAALDPLKKTILDSDISIIKRTNSIKVLSKLCNQSSLDILTDAIFATNNELQGNVLRQINKIIHRNHSLLVNESKIQYALDKIINRYYQQLAVVYDLNLDEKDNLLLEGLQYNLQKEMSNVFQLLAILYQNKSIDAIYYALNSSVTAVKSNAIEAVDNLLNKEHKKFIMPMIEGNSIEDTLEVIEDSIELEHKTVEAWLMKMLSTKSEWIVCTIAHLAGDMGMSSLTPELEKLLTHKSSLVRETALQSLWKILSPKKMLPILQYKLGDKSIQVKNYSNFLMNRIKSSS